ncbi:MAG TPA: cyclopropane-fatty-acyl-phospholipid synthase family protein [Acetobacteraceae bacterium]|nr:cyclopropane-fatty-acyl-phospholipid synthase family protein [Acetobacteraceae bacterium]
MPPHPEMLRRRRDPGMRMLCALLRRGIHKGQLRVLDPHGNRHEFGVGPPSVTIRIATGAAAWWLCLNPDLALGEAYMDGSLTVEAGGIHGLLDLLLRNIGPGRLHWLPRLRAAAQRLRHRFGRGNTLRRARANVAYHYDLSDQLYQLFLDADRQYSCAYFSSPEDSLEQAQDRKLRHIAAKLLLSPGQRVLDIGSGWGGLALHLARTDDVDVTGITLSVEQAAYARRQAEAAGLADRVRFALQDYRDETGRYDRIVSVGMFEHVGVRHYHEYFTRIRDLLAEDGVALVHTIGSVDGPGAFSPWIDKYIFPGGYIPALSEIAPAIEQSGLCITDIEVLRLHYAETLKEWRHRFMANRAPAAMLYDERFCRMWEFYLATCEAAFRHNGLVVFQIQLSRRIDAVPLTRTYVAARESIGVDRHHP